MKRVLMMAVLAGAGWAQTRPASTQAAPASPAQSGAAASQTATQPSVAVPQNAPATAQAPAAIPAAAPATPPAAVVAPQAAMAASLEKQRASVLKQVNALSGKAPASAASFFTVPWMDAAPQFPPAMAGSFNPPPCDPLPNDQLDPLIEQNAQRENLQAALIRAVIGEESGSRPCAVSSKGAQGLMQLMPATIEQFGVTDPFDPKQNVDAGSKFLKQLLAKYNGDLRLALSAYNAGSDRVDKEGGMPQIPETINYVSDILAKLPKP
ncbi:MAG TPA: lytic transglycosylase domain-containing protein [Bryobacteraceae bacterium]|nr:lytic transglycosylase domain-containing protein [Bryobacteraceae bacterium]